MKKNKKNNDMSFLLVDLLCKECCKPLFAIISVDGELPIRNGIVNRTALKFKGKVICPNCGYCEITEMPFDEFIENVTKLLKENNFDLKAINNPIMPMQNYVKIQKGESL